MNAGGVSLFSDLTIGGPPWLDALLLLAVAVMAALLLHRLLIVITKRASARTQVAIDNILVDRSEEHTSELQSLMRISYAVFCLKKKKNKKKTRTQTTPD